MGTLVGRARSGARAIQQGYEGYRRTFRELTRRARDHFARRDWPSGQRDAIERLELYRGVVEILVATLDDILGEDLQDVGTWRTIKAAYAEAIASFPDEEMAETFFNSVTRKVFVTVGVDPLVEFVDLDLRRDRYGQAAKVHRSIPRNGGVAELIAEAVAGFDLGAEFRDLARDAQLAAAEVELAWLHEPGDDEIGSLELLEPVFYRGSGAYLVGRVRGGSTAAPLVIVLVHGPEGIEVDAVLTTTREISIVFSYTRSHFLVDAPRPAAVAGYLAKLLPEKPLAELYVSLGQPKHGKTEMYRDLMGHLGRSMDRFDHAPGKTGMVMVVFTLPSHDYVFKVIRDEFAPPKTNDRRHVMERYQLVFRHDRAGRLIEAHEFEHLIFERSRFAPDLLEELLGATAATVQDKGDVLHFRHLYVERRVRPLDLFLRETEGEEAEAAVLDYGQALRDLAATNIFPGDLLLKNFGVTRNGRVTFYDYDELCLVTDCNFRDLPSDDGGEPSFYVGPHDVFPEEFLNFLGLRPEHRRLFLEAHGEVLTARFWRSLRRRHADGEVLDVLPYPASRRLAGRSS